MPYKVGKHASCPASKPFAVIKEADGSKMGCHPTKAKAQEQMRALYAAESITAEKPPAPGDGRVTTRDLSVTATAAEAIFTNSEDGQKPRAEIVIIRPGQNKSAGSKAKYYTREAIADAVRDGFWAGSPMFVDHGSDEKMPKKRSARDLVSAISSAPGEVWVGPEGEARAMVDFFDPAWATKVEAAKEHIGISNNADVGGRRYRDAKTHELNFQVDAFTNRHSVDWVAFPSAGGGVAQFITATESEDVDMGVDWDALTPEMLAEHRPDLVTEIRAAAESDDGDDGDDKDDEGEKPEGMTTAQIEALIDKRITTAQEAWQEQTSKQADVRKQVADKLATSGLPAKTRTRLAAAFEGEVEYVEQTVQEAIDEAKAELKDAGATLGPVPTEFGSAGTTDGGKSTLQLGQEAIADAPNLSWLAKSVGAKPTTTGKEN